MSTDHDHEEQERAEECFKVAVQVVDALKPLPDHGARVRVLRAAAILLGVDLAAVGLREIDEA